MADPGTVAEMNAPPGPMTVKQFMAGPPAPGSEIEMQEFNKPAIRQLVGLAPDYITRAFAYSMARRAMDERAVAFGLSLPEEQIETDTLLMQTAVNLYRYRRAWTTFPSQNLPDKNRAAFNSLTGWTPASTPATPTKATFLSAFNTFASALAANEAAQTYFVSGSLSTSKISPPPAPLPSVEELKALIREASAQGGGRRHRTRRNRRKNRKTRRCLF